MRAILKARDTPTGQEIARYDCGELGELGRSVLVLRVDRRALEQLTSVSIDFEVELVDDVNAIVTGAAAAAAIVELEGHGAPGDPATGRAATNGPHETPLELNDPRDAVLRLVAAVG